MFEIQYDDTQVRAALNKLLQAGSDLTPAMRKIAGVMADNTEDSFANEEAPDGTPWQPLSANTIKARTNKGSWPGQILQQDGSLASSINRHFGEDFAMVGTNKPYTLTHQLGRDNIPARPFLGVSDNSKDEILTILRAHLLS